MLASFHIVLAMKPIEGNFAQNAMEHGVAGLNIDAGRIGTGSDKISGGCINYYDKVRSSSNYGRKNQQAIKDACYSQGRFPANLILEENDEVKKLFPETVGAGNVREVAMKDGTKNCYGEYGSRRMNPNIHGNTGGSASRFFKHVKSE